MDGEDKSGFLKRVLKDVMAQILADPHGRPAMLALDAADVIRLLDGAASALSEAAPSASTSGHVTASRRFRNKPRGQGVQIDATTILLRAPSRISTTMASVAPQIDTPHSSADVEQVLQLIDRGQRILKDVHEQRIISDVSVITSLAALARAHEKLRTADVKRTSMSERSAPSS